MISVALLLFSGLRLALLRCKTVTEGSLSTAGLIAAPRTPLRLCFLYSPLSRLFPPLTFPPLLSPPPPSLPSPRSSLTPSSFLPPSSLPLPPLGLIALRTSPSDRPLASNHLV